MSAFYECKRVRITYDGTEAEWERIAKNKGWNYVKKYITVCCADGELKTYDESFRP